jgi:hypothetical protein
VRGLGIEGTTESRGAKDPESVGSGASWDDAEDLAPSVLAWQESQGECHRRV